MKHIQKKYINLTEIIFLLTKIELIYYIKIYIFKNKQNMVKHRLTSVSYEHLRTMKNNVAFILLC